jgi:hypothetical protein
MLDPKDLPEPDDSGEPRPKKSSPAKVEANQKNSRSSTGPKTARGKKNSSRNAIKHGLLTKELLITTGAGKENKAELDALIAGMRDDRKPKGMAEELYVQEIIISYWRSTRALRSERGAVTLGSEIPSENPELTETEVGALGRDDETRNRLLQNSRGLRYLLRVVEGIRKQVQSSGHLPLGLRLWLSPAEVWNGGSKKRAILAALGEEIRDLTERKVQLEEQELQKRNATRDFASLPPQLSLNLNHRYETANVRIRRKAEQSLDEMQARRKADERAALKNGADPEEPEDV